MSSTYSVGFWLSEQARLRFRSKPKRLQVPRAHEEAMHLDLVLLEAARRTGESRVGLDDLLSSAPTFGMTKVEVERALIVLHMNGRIRMVKSPGRLDSVELNPMFFPLNHWPGS